MATMKLTQALLPMLHVAGIYWDRDVRPLGYRVRLSGHRSWIVRYTPKAGGKERRLHLGTGEELTLKQARGRAREVLGYVERGGDPLGERHKEATAHHHTLANVVQQYVLQQDPKEFRSLDKRKRDLDRWMKRYGHRAMEDVRRPDVVAFLEHLREKHGQGAADSAYVAFSKLANWYAVRTEGYISPIVRGLWSVNTKKRERTLTDDELRALWSCTDTKHPYHALLRFLLLAATRLEEACGMERQEVSPEGTWTIPAARMKNKQNHVVPLSPAAEDVLRSVPPVELSPLVFTINGRTTISGYTKFGEVLRARMAPLLGVDPETYDWWTPHDLRRTFSTRMHEQGLADPHIIEACLAHIVGGVAAHYNQATYFQAKRAALAAWAEYVIPIATGN
jgi:integrase